MVCVRQILCSRGMLKKVVESRRDSLPMYGKKRAKQLSELAPLARPAVAGGIPSYMASDAVQGGHGAEMPVYGPNTAAAAASGRWAPAGRALASWGTDRVDEVAVSPHAQHPDLAAADEGVGPHLLAANRQNGPHPANGYPSQIVAGANLGADASGDSNDDGIACLVMMVYRALVWNAPWLAAPIL